MEITNLIPIENEYAERRHGHCLATELQTAYIEPHWYVAQTCSRHEKRIAAQFDLRGLEYFLPLYETVSRWKDRHVRLQMPLFPGYLFVRVPLQGRSRALQVPSVVRLVGFGGFPVPIPDDEMKTLRSGLTNLLRAEPHPYLTVGRHVRIKSGPLTG